ncbi:probable phosphopantothenoylcysteine decarboxylase, partial [Abrus precatorius]|uniref:phosphopantothenoylcysteine decarboxylase n=1 Tax=Abrus precatorius TaxID=3816 RepID=A0A8B8K3J1_ABRPR
FETTYLDNTTRKPRILLAACGSVAAVKLGLICSYFAEWAEIKVVVTKSSLRFIDKLTIPMDVFLYCDEHEWCNWKRIGDCVLHIELRRWADIMVIAPLSANTLAKIAGGLCDNLLTCIVRAWDYNKPIFVAPSMNSHMWQNPLTEQHFISMDELGIILIPPVTQRTTGEECVYAEMADPFIIFSTCDLLLGCLVYDLKPLYTLE